MWIFTSEKHRQLLLQHVTGDVERKLVLLINPHPRVAHEIHREPAAKSEMRRQTYRDDGMAEHRSITTLCKQHSRFLASFCRREGERNLVASAEGEALRARERR
jgi:hypothetical protein